MTKKLNIAKLIIKESSLNTKDKVNMLTTIKYIKEEEINNLLELAGVLDSEKVMKRLVKANDKHISGKDVVTQVNIALRRLKHIIINNKKRIK